jgi:hypothetical protein
MKAEPQTGSACHERASFARALEFDLGSEQLNLLFWAGDGGVFAKRLDRGQPRAVAQAIDRVFRKFDSFRVDHHQLGIRVTATYLPDVVIYHEAGYWCSDELNDFLKYERHFAVQGGAVITERLYRKLYDDADRERFTVPRHVIIDGHRCTTYVDSKHLGKYRAPRVGFQQWLEGRLSSGDLPLARKNDKGYIEVGESTVLEGARDAQGIGEVLATPHNPLTRDEVEEMVLPEHRADWNRHVRDYERDNIRGWSTAVFGYRADISEDPFRLSYRPIEYAHGRAFHALLESDPTFPPLYRETAFRVMKDTATLPNILCVQVAAVIGDDTESLLVIAQRSVQRPGGYHGNRWSTSITEQFSPFAHERGSEKSGYYQVPPDQSIDGCAARALSEELLGDDFSGRTELCIAALAMENYLDNFFFCVLADLRPLSFSQIVDAWNRARDQREHKILAALTLDEAALCMSAKTIPIECWRRMLAGNRVCPAADLPSEELVLQPNAHIRIASFLWFADRNRR